MHNSVLSGTGYSPLVEPVSPASSESTSIYGALTQTSQSTLSLSSQLSTPPEEAAEIDYHPPSGEQLTYLMSKLTPTGQSVMEKIVSEFYCLQPGQSIVNFAQRLADISPGVTRQDLSLMLDTELKTMDAVKLKQVWLSSEGEKARRVIARDARLARGENENRGDHANRLKKRFPKLTPRDGALLSGARYGVIRPSSIYTPKKLSAAGQQMKCRIELGQFPRYQHETSLEYCYRLRQAENRLSLIDLAILTKVSRNVLERHWAFITCKLSKRAEGIKQMLDDPLNCNLRRKASEDKVVWLRRVLGNPAVLTRNEAAVIFKLSIKTLNNIPEYIKKPLGDAGKRIKERLVLKDADYQPCGDEDKLSWIIRLKRTLEPGLNVIDAAKLTLLTVSTLSKHKEFFTKNVSDRARKVIEDNQANPDKFYRKGKDENTLTFITRIRKRHPKYSPRELSMLINMSVSTVRRAMYKAGQKVARDRFRPEVITTPVETPPAAPLQPANETDYAQAQWVSLYEIDRRLATDNWRRVPNSSFTGTTYANCLIIALLQHAFECYVQNEVINNWANWYRGLLIDDWLNHDSGFRDDGYMAFGHYEDRNQGASARLIEMINDDLINREQRPLWVVNHSFAAHQHYTERLGSRAENARIVHIVNTGQHFEALLPMFNYWPA